MSMTTQQRIDVMLAADAGKPIQRRQRFSDFDGDGKWEYVASPKWDFSQFDYRVTPEPKKVVTVKYRVTYADGGVRDYDNIDDAIKRWTNSFFNPTLQKIEKTTNE